MAMEKNINDILSRPKDWHKDAVGGMWEEIGKLQFNFLLEKGLKPEHYLLDVGCGSLRGGIHFIGYLEPDHYFGTDISKELLDAGKDELEKLGLSCKNPVLANDGDFDFRSLHREFDFALAQSVFTHLPLNSIIKCIMNMEKALVRGGRFYATFFEDPKGKNDLGPALHRRIDGPPIGSYFDKDPYHYDTGTFEWICKGTKLKAEYVGDWGHPRGQKMMRFVKL
jgi:ubiquinone/menaquinone biosynthesis C-methylase UbiE